MEANKQQSPLTVMRIIWGALLGSHFLYAFALYMRVQQWHGDKEAIHPMFVPALASTAIILYATAIILPKNLINSEKKKHQDKKLEDLMSVYLTPFILRLALFEAAAIQVFVLAHQLVDLNYYLPSLAINVGLFALNFPTEQKVRDAFNQ